ncbi:hypothetical protein Mal4_33090 [Maioricimonas rarisocia]|uniref:Cytochrome C n=1 Tax=Maioricimonas rarisocia TaxID=2528026 RepID=A0A517Z917_9PLAN|nr:hypothetical protein [Maioricimonas rarisocia]QDU38977.1 hypothetical protein Mal4_33090 [Maioricimonas rarisocia]
MGGRHGIDYHELTPVEALTHVFDSVVCRRPTEHIAFAAHEGTGSGAVVTAVATAIQDAVGERSNIGMAGDWSGLSLRTGDRVMTGQQQRHIAVVFLGAVAVVVLLAFRPGVAEPPPPSPQQTAPKAVDEGAEFMQAKLGSVHEIMDGLALEDFERIEQGADELLRMAELASWKVSRSPVYMHYSFDFERTAKRLRQAAEQRSIEEATFAFMHLTVSCTACHQHVRGVVQMAPAAADARIVPIEPGRGLVR